ncbi:hypothetical protein SARC_14402, partial [Sphaeroforma arctica JP610]
IYFWNTLARSGELRQQPHNAIRRIHAHACTHTAQRTAYCVAAVVCGAGCPGLIRHAQEDPHHECPVRNHFTTVWHTE